MTVFWPALILGVVLLVAGVLVLGNSGPVAAWFRSANGRAPGREGLDSFYTTRNARAVGIGFVLIGVLGIVLSLLDLNW